MDGAAAAAEITEDAAENRPLNGGGVDQNHTGSSVEDSADSKYYASRFKRSLKMNCRGEI